MTIDARLSFLLASFFLIIHHYSANAEFLDWLWLSKKEEDQGHMISIPFEVKTEDEKFLEEALKFTDLIKSSSLDICQHNVVLKIKTSCSSMTEEELAKLSVNLLNCQSSVDGRKTFTCTETMSLKQCTESMDPSMWNAYHMMNNRARAVCLASRRAQFDALTELTVNKLMRTSQEQINHLRSLHEGQEKLEQLQLDTVDTVRQGNVEILIQQDRVRSAQLLMQNIVNYNLKELTREKALIAAGHRELANMAEKIKEKLEKTHNEVYNQALETASNHRQLLSDIEAIQIEAQNFFKHLETSTSFLMRQNDLAAAQLDNTLEKLTEINKTVDYLLQMANATNDQIIWIKSFLGTNGAQVEYTFTIILHFVYLFTGMLLTVFLKLPFITRCGLILFVPLNLLLSLERSNEQRLNFPELTMFLILLTIGHEFIQLIRSYAQHTNYKLFLINGITSENASNSQPKVLSPKNRILDLWRKWWTTIATYLTLPSRKKLLETDEVGNGISASFSFVPESTTLRHRTNCVVDNDAHNTNTYVSKWLDASSPYNLNRQVHSSSPSRSSVRSSIKNQCTAVCRNGRKCKNTSTPGKNHCHIHESGSSNS